jgi:hypothetical protein
MKTGNDAQARERVPVRPVEPTDPANGLAVTGKVSTTAAF